MNDILQAILQVGLQSGLSSIATILLLIAVLALGARPKDQKKILDVVPLWKVLPISIVIFMFAIVINHFAMNMLSSPQTQDYFLGAITVETKTPHTPPIEWPSLLPTITATVVSGTPGHVTPQKQVSPSLPYPSPTATAPRTPSILSSVSLTPTFTPTPTPTPTFSPTPTLTPTPTPCPPYSGYFGFIYPFDDDTFNPKSEKIKICVDNNRYIQYQIRYATAEYAKYNNSIESFETIWKCEKGVECMKPIDDPVATVSWDNNKMPNREGEYVLVLQVFYVHAEKYRQWNKKRIKIYINLPNKNER